MHSREPVMPGRQMGLNRLNVIHDAIFAVWRVLRRGVEALCTVAMCQV